MVPFRLWDGHELTTVLWHVALNLQTLEKVFGFEENLHNGLNRMCAVSVWYKDFPEQKAMSFSLFACACRSARTDGSFETKMQVALSDNTMYGVAAYLQRK
jgi:hypothetical protein